MAKKQDHQSFIDMLVEAGRQMKMPEVEIEEIIEHHRKNLEALQQAATTASSGAAGIMERQRAMLEQVVKDMMHMLEDLRTASGPQDYLAKQSDHARRAFETAVRNMAELAELYRKSGAESTEVLQKRMREAMEEMRKALKAEKG
jgi:phasin family protein